MPFAPWLKPMKIQSSPSMIMELVATSTAYQNYLKKPEERYTLINSLLAIQRFPTRKLSAMNHRNAWDLRSRKKTLIRYEKFPNVNAHPSMLLENQPEIKNLLFL